MSDWEERLTELEIRLALQNELVDSLNGTVAKMQQTLDLQQAQLRWLYRRLDEGGRQHGDSPFDPTAELPPHY
ncbi:MAG: SlyX family protein [Eikenella sp.]|nr:SlyX family protein [Eikenella sp.]